VSFSALYITEWQASRCGRCPLGKTSGNRPGRYGAENSPYPFRKSNPSSRSQFSILNHILARVHRMEKKEMLQEFWLRKVENAHLKLRSQREKTYLRDNGLEEGRWVRIGQERIQWCAKHFRLFRLNSVGVQRCAPSLADCRNYIQCYSWAPFEVDNVLTLYCDCVNWWMARRKS
jgi:hypothetical protein